MSREISDFSNLIDEQFDYAESSLNRFIVFLLDLF